MKVLLPTLLSAWIATVALAQTPPPSTPTTSADETEGNAAFWQASLANGGHYLVKLSQVTCAAKHEYVSDGVARVVEVTVGADAAVVARFYFFEPIGKDTPLAGAQALINRAQDAVQQAAARVSPGAAKLNVVKNYPTSTHAHTVEFAVQEEATLNSLYASLMAALNTGRGRIWKEGGGSK